MIAGFKAIVLERLWIAGDMTLLSSLYVYEVTEILTLLDAAYSICDLALLGGFTISEYGPNDWAVTVTVNKVEPIGSVTCHFVNGNAYDINLNEYDEGK